MHRVPLLVSAFLLAPASAVAQGICDGNGQGAAIVAATALPIGGTAELTFGSVLAPGGFAAVGFADGLGPVNVPLPGFGLVCIDAASPALNVGLFVLDGNGFTQLTAALPNDPALAALPPLYALVAVFEPNGVSIPRTVRLDWQLRDHHDVLTGLQARSLHTATTTYASIFDNDQTVLVAGGATGSIIVPVPIATTELYEPLQRAFRAGPSLALPRVMHCATRLFDGRILITGGATTSGLGTSTCEIFDPRTEQMTPAAAMSQPRFGHAASLLPNGRVLVSGGFQDWQNAGANFASRLSTAQATTEIYDPSTDTWSPGLTMTSARAGHSQTALLDGRLLIAGGVSGGSVVIISGGSYQIPVFTANCQVFDPTTGSLTLVQPLAQARGFHAASLMLSGNVLVTGGAASIGGSGAAACSTACETWNGTTWSPAAALPTGVAFHSQVFDVGSNWLLRATSTTTPSDGS